jgi:hypothetical protein
MSPLHTGPLSILMSDDSLSDISAHLLCKKLLSFAKSIFRNSGPCLNFRFTPSIICDDTAQILNRFSCSICCPLMNILMSSSPFF